MFSFKLFSKLNTKQKNKNKKYSEEIVVMFSFMVAKKLMLL